jgi:hypothetical protein
MKRDIKWLMETTNISIKELTDIINQQGGRDLKKPIIYSEKCDGRDCGVRQLF